MKHALPSMLLAAALPLPAAAHGETGAAGWVTLDPWTGMPLLVLALLYLRGMRILRTRRTAPKPARPAALASFCTSMAAAFLALVWPLDALGAISFAAHMTQHMLLIAVAAPLLILAEPALPVMMALPAGWRRINRRLATVHRAWRMLSRPAIAFAVHGALVWLWHAPLLFESALRWRWAHAAEHIALLASALLFWNAMRQAGRAGGNGYGAAALWTLGTLIHTGLLGALITFAPRPLYPFYRTVTAAPLPPMEDQQLAGLVMWIPAGACYLAIGLYYAAAWLRSAGQAGAQPDVTLR